VVEHYLDTVGVTGSNPVSRTILSAFTGEVLQTFLDCVKPMLAEEKNPVYGLLALYRKKGQPKVSTSGSLQIRKGNSSPI
jgi:hypothetical protein